MAIKVNGTTVINDSRTLSNIASVDSTTVAALGAAGVGGGKNNSLVVLQDVSGTLTIPIAGDVVFIAVGGGGGGAAISYPNNTTASQGGARYSASGGAGGGTAIKKLTGVSAGSTYSCTIGAGGTRTDGIFSSASSSVRTGSGGAGGQTTISGTGISLTANGGGGGNFNTSGNATSGAAGTASGGDLNFTGSTSSTSSQTAAAGDYGATYVASSGGSPSSVGTGASPQDALATTNSYSPGFMEPMSGKNPDDAQSNDFYQRWAVNYFRNQNTAPYKLYPTKYQTLVVPKAGSGFATASYNSYGGMAINGEWGGGGGGCCHRGGGQGTRYAVAGSGGQGFVAAIVFADI